MNLKTIRKRVVKIDSDIHNLLKRRFELSLLMDSIDKKQEELNQWNISKKGKNESKVEILSSGFLEKLDSQLNTELVKLFEKNLQLMGFQGEHGAYSELASMTFSKEYFPIPCKKFGDIIEGVEKGVFSTGLLPVENSIEGSVNEVNDLLIYSDMKIVGEVYQPIEHCLLTLKETNYREIKHVYSHPQALAQCRGFIFRNRMEAFPFYDTAGAAKMLSERSPAASAVIASKLCAQLYDLEIIKENISDKVNNFTRFLILSKEETGNEGNKSSIIFTAKHKAGALYTILELFKGAQVNLCRIESRPFKEKPGNYVFFVDFDGSKNDQKIKDILKEVKKQTLFYKFLGTYKSGKTVK